MSASGSQAGKDFNDADEALLVQAQKAWIKFRDDNVTFYAARYRPLVRADWATKTGRVRRGAAVTIRVTIGDDIWPGAQAEGKVAAGGVK